MINKFYLNEIEVIEILPYKNGNKLLLIDGSELCSSKNKYEGLQINCPTCDKKFKITVIRKGKNGHLNRKYKCSSCNSRGENNAFYGKKHSTDFKNRLSIERKGKWLLQEDNPMYGKTIYDVWFEKYGKETADKLEEERLKKMSVVFSGENNPFFGKSHSAEVKSLLAVKSKGHWNSLSQEEKEERMAKQKAGMLKFSIEHPEKLKENKLKANRISLRKQHENRQMNKIEILVFKFLNEKFPDLFEYSVILANYQFDFGCKEKRILIEVQGDYWHCNPKIYKKPKNETQKIKKEMDDKKREFAQKHNFKLIEIWETDINNKNFDNLEKQIRISF